MPKDKLTAMQSPIPIGSSAINVTQILLEIWASSPWYLLQCVLFFFKQNLQLFFKSCTLFETQYIFSRTEIPDPSWPVLTRLDHILPVLIIPNQYWSFLTSPYLSWSFLTNSDHSWPVLIIPDQSGSFLTSPDHSRPFLNILDHSWSFLTNPDHSWPVLIITDKSWPVLIISDQYW